MVSAEANISAEVISGLRLIAAEQNPSPNKILE